MKAKTCERCKHYEHPFGMYGICDENPNCKKQVHKLDVCAAFKQRTFKVKPRRLCDFCERGKHMESEEWEHELEFVKMTSILSVMFLNEADGVNEAATFPVKYCPVCGRKLVGE